MAERACALHLFFKSVGGAAGVYRGSAEVGRMRAQNEMVSLLCSSGFSGKLRKCTGMDVDWGGFEAGIYRSMQ